MKLPLQFPLFTKENWDEKLQEQLLLWLSRLMQTLQQYKIDLTLDTKETTSPWTPVDGSGAALTFTTLQAAKYTKVGREVHFTWSFTFPVTVNGANALVAGLPYTAEASSFPCSITSDFGTAFYAAVILSTQTIAFYTLANVRILNSALSGKTITINGLYRSTT